MIDVVDSIGCILYEEKEVIIILLVIFLYDVVEVLNKYFSDIVDVVVFMKEN